MSEDPPERTIIGGCSAGPRLVSDRVRSSEWESFPRREPRPARERLGPTTSSNTRAKRWSQSD
jgi:hypothetical protein